MKNLEGQQKFQHCCLGMRASVTVESLNLQSYEVLCFKALHCTMNHIKNILEEIPYHISDIDTLIKLKEILAVQLNKEKKWGVDYRKTLIYLTIALYQTTTHDVRALLATLCEMVEIFYAQDRKRSPKLILRLHNLCWRHAILCHKVMTQLERNKKKALWHILPSHGRPGTSELKA